MGKTPEYMRNYRRSESGKTAVKKYVIGAKSKERLKRYAESEKGRATAVRRRRERRERNDAIILAAKSVPCSDCEHTFDAVCMDFHHLRDKKFNIGWKRCTPNTLLAEIAKCIVICANCHRLRHKSPFRE